MTLQIKEVAIMFLGMEWYWWLLIVVALVICIPFKVKEIYKYAMYKKVNILLIETGEEKEPDRKMG